MLLFNLPSGCGADCASFQESFTAKTYFKKGIGHNDTKPTLCNIWLYHFTNVLNWVIGISSKMSFTRFHHHAKQPNDCSDILVKQLSAASNNC